MRAARRAKFAWLLLAASAFSGCATSDFWGGPGPVSQGPTPAAIGQPANPPGMMGEQAGFNPAMPVQQTTPLQQAMQFPNPFGSGTPSPPSYPTQPSKGFFATLLEATDPIAAALTIEPKVIPAPDPVRLDNFPTNGQQVSADLHYHAGRMFEAQNSLHVAATHYRDALMKNPNDVRLLTSYARVLDRLGNFPDAEATYRRAIELNPNDSSTYNDLAMCLARQKNWDAAIGTLERAIRIDPQNPRYRNNLALVLVDANHIEEAFQNLLAAHGEAVAHYNLGYMLLEKNRVDEARQHFVRSLQLKPDLTQAQQMLAHLSPPQQPTPAPAMDDDALVDSLLMPNQYQTAAQNPPVRLPNVNYSEASLGRFGDTVR